MLIASLFAWMLLILFVLAIFKICSADEKKRKRIHTIKPTATVDEILDNPVNFEANKDNVHDKWTDAEMIEWLRSDEAAHYRSNKQWIGLMKSIRSKSETAFYDQLRKARSYEESLQPTSYQKLGRFLDWWWAIREARATTDSPYLLYRRAKFIKRLNDKLR